MECKDRTPGRLEVRESKANKPGNFQSKLVTTMGKGATELGNGLARDLARIGQGLFLCDRAFRRGQTLGTKTRVLTLWVPVENVDRWERIKGKIEAWAQFVSHDIWTIHFVKYPAPKQESAGSPDPSMKKAVVSLFSDGLDSLAGAAHTLLNDEAVVFVSHNPPGFETSQKRVDALRDCLGDRGVRTYFANFSFLVSDKDLTTQRRNRFPETRRRTRPLLYLSMAGAIALEYGMRNIRLNENGILAVNLPIRPDRQGVEISRHAHPETLAQYEDILNSLKAGGGAFTVSNPFFGMTKAQEIAVLTKAVTLVSETISCEYGRQQMRRINSHQPTGKKAKECGLCLPCLMRRIAVNGAGFGEPSGHYAYAIAKAAKAASSGRSHPDLPLFDLLKYNLEDIRLFCQEIQGMDLKQFSRHFLYELSLLSRDPGNVPALTQALFDLHQQFALEALSFLP